ncbi:hypothetical protein OIU74_027296 [Salix koriyanagi]|uniref:Uncharacterized protein n=1 Tax=Salix koriyanagi TaxID=2511006 RepID=A0A9Q1A504_9ROSI|nr:hypothetical protein OIU74_027296 [Salix koriyanagi]
MDQLVLDRSKVGVGDHSKRQAVKHLARDKEENGSYEAKTLSRVIKTVFFETLLSKRVRDGKGNPCQDSNIGSKRSSSMDSKISLDDKTNSVNKQNPSRPRNVIRKLVVAGERREQRSALLQEEGHNGRAA